MRWWVICLAAPAVLAACGSQPGPAHPSAPSSDSVAPTVNSANVKRIRPALPAGYEVTDIAGPVSAAALWGFGSGWSAAPPQCAALADPAPADAGARGLSASGPGGTVYVVVAAAPAAAMSGVAAPAPAADAAAPAADVAALAEQCGQWTMNFAHTTGVATLVEAPHIDGVQTIAMTVATRTAVESGTETVGQASTAQAYLDHHVAFVTLVTEPGSARPPLDGNFVADLLVKTVAALRG